MKQFIALLLLLVTTSASLCASGHQFDDECVSYRVLYKWGLINKQAGRATICLRRGTDRYHMSLVARSEPWADKFYQVRDTLLGTATLDGFLPLVYQKMSHEGSEDKHDVVRFEYRDGKVIGHCTRRVVKKGRLAVDQQQTLEAAGATVDMLTSYYYMRSLPFENWKAGTRYQLTIFSGKRKERLTFSYHGVETVKIGERKIPCYHITFIFTGDGGKKTSDDMDAWITTDSRRLPLQLEGKLPVGKVRCELMQ